MGTSSLVPFKKGFATLFFSRLGLGTHILLRKICMNGCENKSLGNSSRGLQVVPGISNVIGYVLINPPGFSVFSRKIEFLSGHEKHPKKKEKEKPHRLPWRCLLRTLRSLTSQETTQRGERSKHSSFHFHGNAAQSDTAHCVLCPSRTHAAHTPTPKHVPPHAGSYNTTNLNLK